MGFLSELRNRSFSPLDDRWYYPGGYLFGGRGTKTKAGTVINEYTAMQLAIVWACIKILSEDSASIPLILYKKRKGGGKDKVTDDERYGLLHDKPNSEMTAMSFRETYISHLVGWGNAYAEIVRTGGRLNKIKELYPIPPDKVKVKRDRITKKIVYEITKAPGVQNSYDTENIFQNTYQREKILHTPGLSFNGLIGYSPIAVARENMGLGVALEEFAQRFFSNGTNMGGILSHPNKLEGESLKNLRESINSQNTSLENSSKFMILEDDMKYHKNTIPPNEAQFIESRIFQTGEIGSKIYRMPPIMYGDTTKSAYKGIEQQLISYTTLTLRPWLVRFEQTLNMWLLSDSERGTFFWEHLVDGLLRGDTKTRYEAYQIGRQNTWLNADTIRDKENMNPIPGGEGKKYENPNITVKDQDKKDPDDDTEELNSKRKFSKEKMLDSYRNLFTTTIQKIVSREALAIRKAVKSKLNKGEIVEFRSWAQEFYKTSPEYLRTQIFPLISSYSEFVTLVYCEDKDIRTKEEHGSIINRCAEEYTNAFVERYIKNSLSKINSILDGTQGIGIMNEKMIACVDGWNVYRALKISEEETGLIINKINISKIEGRHKC